MAAVGQVLTTGFVPFLRSPREAPLWEVRQGMGMLGDVADRGHLHHLPLLPPATPPLVSTLWAPPLALAAAPSAGAIAPSRRLAAPGPAESGHEWIRMTLDPLDLFLPYLELLFEKVLRGFPIFLPRESPAEAVLETLEEAKRFKLLGRRISGEFFHLIELVQGIVREAVDREVSRGQDSLTARITQQPVDLIYPGNLPDLEDLETNFLELRAIFRLLGRDKGGRIRGRFGGYTVSQEEIDRAEQACLASFPEARDAILASPAATFKFRRRDTLVYDSLQTKIWVERKEITVTEFVSGFPFNCRNLLLIALRPYALAWAERVIKGVVGKGSPLDDLIGSVVLGAHREWKSSVAEFRRATDSVRSRFDGLPPTIREREGSFEPILEGLSGIVGEVEKMGEEDDVRRGSEGAELLRRHFGFREVKGHAKRAWISMALAGLLDGEGKVDLKEIFSDLLRLEPGGDYLDQLWEEARRIRDESRATGTVTGNSPVVERGPVPAVVEPPVAREVTEDDLLPDLQREARQLGEIEEGERQRRAADRQRLSLYKGQLGDLLDVLEEDLMRLLGEERIDEIATSEWIDVRDRTIELRKAREEATARIERRFARGCLRPLGESANTGPMLDELKRILDQVRDDHFFVSAALKG